MVFSSKSSDGDRQSTPSFDLVNGSEHQGKQSLERLFGESKITAPQSKPWSGLNLRSKATAIAIALGVVPIMTIGAATYNIASQQIASQTKASQEDAARIISGKINNFMFERYGDLQVLSQLPLLTDAKSSNSLLSSQKQKTLDNYVASYTFYDSISVADLNGNTILQSSGQPVGNIAQTDYFKTVKDSQKPVIVNQASANSAQTSVVMAAPVFDAANGKMISIIRTRIPVKNINNLLAEENLGHLSEKHEFKRILNLIDDSGKTLLTTQPKQVSRDFKQQFPQWSTWRQQAEVEPELIQERGSNQKFLASYQPLDGRGAMPKLGWSFAILENEANAFIAQRQLMFTLLFGLGIAAITVGAIAAYLANRITRPILETTAAVEKLGRGKLQTRVAVSGQDEISTLGANINYMAEQLQDLLLEQSELSRQQLNLQESNARQQAENARQQREAREKLQRRAMELLTEVDPISQGDLSVRATVTEDEIGTIADSYNATVNSLRKIVTQVQSAAENMVATTSESESSVKELSGEALRQSDEIRQALSQLQAMSASIATISATAKQAELAVSRANQTVAKGDLAMNRTVAGIMNIKETVTETRKKVLQLGEASQGISKAVKLIANFAAQTNLLALKASIEAARAGEEGRGFAVLAEEVRVLAQQSGQATSEIESIVNSIQKETEDLLLAMETSTEQVSIGTQLVEETRQSLNQITDASGEIDDFVTQIADAADEQSQASVSMTQKMDNVAEIASQTSQEVARVSAVFSQLLDVANALQNSASQFKVG